MSNIALQQPVVVWDRRGKEIINGKVVTMAPARPAHQMAIYRISRIFGNYLEGKPCKVLFDVYVHLTNKNKVAPDISIVCNPDIIKEDGIHGAPDLVIEVLSSSTAARDRLEKKKIYEEFGIGEYWIVDVKNRVIEVYSLTDSKYELRNIYTIYDEFDAMEMTQEEKAGIVTEFKTSLFDDLIIDIREIFKDSMD